ncbi:TCEA3 protein, partial [Columbina picui]|nr:TCEA3 protein [Columbina picui]
MGPAEELVRIAKKLDKMVARKSTEGALDLLKSLTGYTMTIQLLQTTRIGVAVNSVRKHCSDEEVVASAKILIKNWKRLLEPSGTPKKEKDVDGKKEKDTDKEKEKKGKALDFPSCPNEGVKQPRSPAEKHREKHKERRDSADSRSSSASAVSASSSPQKRPANSSKAKAETPRTPTSPPFSPSPCLLAPCYLTGDSVRDKCIEMLTAALRMDDDYKEFGVNCEKMASEIEDHILCGAGGSPGSVCWDTHTRGLGSGAGDRTEVLGTGQRVLGTGQRNVLCGAIAPDLIARMTAEEMASDELKELRNAMTQEAIREHQMAKTGGTVTDLFQCGKCKKKNCTYNQVQTRSADEPMTTFVLCNECGNRWKVC